jgi:energy-coupling factor transporter ATP-binding protein EcfA2
MPEYVEYLTINEINALLNVIDDVRDRAIVALFLNTGVFLNELASLKFDSIDWEKKILAVPGNRKREIPLNDQAFEALAKWSKERPEVKTTALFITTKGKPKDLSARSVDHLIRKYADQAGIRRKVNAQILRNTFAVRLFSEEISSDKAAAILGITDSESINRYLQASKQPPPKPEMLTAEEMSKMDTRPKLVKLVSKYFPTKPKPARPVTEIKGPIIPSPEEVVFGRESIIENIKANLNKNQPVLLIGLLGIGRTHVLKHISKISGPNTIYISSPSPLKNMLSQICDKLDPEWKKRVKTRASTKEIIEFIVKGKGAKPPILIIDNLNNLKISDVDSFIALIENFTILASTDELIPRLKQVWWKFKQIELHPLSEHASKELIKYLTQNLSISDYEMLETRILSLSNRLPLAIVDMTHQLSHQPVVTREIIRDVYHEAGIRYRDWTPFLIVLWGVAMVFRFVALGTHSFEGYIMAGVGIAALMTTIRFLRMVK